MTKKKDKSRRPPGLPSLAVNPLAAAPVVEPKNPLSDPAPVLDPNPAAAQPNPSEFDPGEDDGESDLENPSVSPSLGSDEEDEEDDDDDEESLDEKPKDMGPSDITVNNLGNPKSPSFNPNDGSKGFYQGIDPSTGERVYSK